MENACCVELKTLCSQMGSSSVQNAAHNHRYLTRFDSVTVTLTIAS